MGAVECMVSKDVIVNYLWFLRIRCNVIDRRRRTEVVFYLLPWSLDDAMGCMMCGECMFVVRSKGRWITFLSEGVKGAKRIQYIRRIKCKSWSCVSHAPRVAFYT